MTRQTTKKFLYSFGLNTDININRYENWWSLSELKTWEQFIEVWYKKEVKNFKNTIITKK